MICTIEGAFCYHSLQVNWSIQKHLKVSKIRFGKAFHNLLHAQCIYYCRYFTAQFLSRDCQLNGQNCRKCILWHQMWRCFTRFPQRNFLFVMWFPSSVKVWNARVICLRRSRLGALRNNRDGCRVQQLQVEWHKSGRQMLCPSQRNFIRFKIPIRIPETTNLPWFWREFW